MEENKQNTIAEFIEEKKSEVKYNKDGFSVSVQELPQALEAVLFVSGDPVSINYLEEILGVEKKVIEPAIDRLVNDYANNPWSGLLVRKLEDSYVMTTKPSMKSIIERMFMPKMTPPLSQASYETLAVIAYNQPVTRAQVEIVRGVSSDSIVTRLVERGWVEEAGTLDAPGRPTLFRTTQQFLLDFGIESIEDLPHLELMSYKTIRDLEVSLEKASGVNDRQLTIENIMDAAKAENTSEQGEDYV